MINSKFLTYGIRNGIHELIMSSCTFLYSRVARKTDYWVIVITMEKQCCGSNVASLIRCILICFYRNRNGESALVADAQETAKDAGITS